MSRLWEQGVQEEHLALWFHKLGQLPLAEYILCAIGLRDSTQELGSSLTRTSLLGGGEKDAAIRSTR